MDVVLWLFIGLCFFVSFVGLLIPVLPAVGFVWLGVLCYHFFLQPGVLSGGFWSAMLVLTGVYLLTDHVANVWLVKRYGGSTVSIFASVIGVFVGVFFFPPFGILFVPFLLVLAVEMLQDRTLEASLKVAFATLLAFLSGAFAKGVLQLVMIVYFWLTVRT